MAKVSKKRGSKKRCKQNSDELESREAKPPVVYDDDDGDEDDGLNGAGDEDGSSEEDEGENERKHQKLLEAISALGGKKKHLGERSEAATHMSEFTVSAEGEADKVQLSDLIATTPAVSAQSRKQLNDLQRSKKTVECPLSKRETERIQRDLAFQKAASEVSRWKSVITQNQKAEQLVFPLNPEQSGPRPIERVVTGWKAQTPLEQEVFALLSANKQPINDPILTPAEEASVKAMSLEEAKIRRAELQKARALQSYYESKTRRERKIKSKKYHRVQNKAKRKDLLKNFEEIVKADPEAALEELKKMELVRMQERMSLKHQNSGKWAKSRAIMAKYDEGARRAMQQQLEVNKELTQKLVTSPESEEEVEKGYVDTDMLPDFVNVAELQQDSSNPWMRGKLSEEPTERKMSSMESVTVQAAEEEEEEMDEPEEEVLLRDLDSRRKQRQAQESDTPVILIDDNDDDEEEDITKDQTVEKEAEASGVEEGLSEFTRLFRGLTEGLKAPEAAGDADIRGPSAQLEEGLIRIRSVEDAEDLPEEELPEPPQVPLSEPAQFSEHQVGLKRKQKKGIKLMEVLTKETKAIRVPLALTITDSEDQQDQRGLIKEAFACDDVISDFIRDKRRQEEAGKPKVVDLTLPGWGEWGGLGLKPSSRKRRRFRTKVAPAPPRKDQHLPSVIISEKRTSSICLHQVNSLPFPFENHAQFESTIRSPLGRTWNTERTVKKVTKPRVLTRLGTIIQPMDEEELLKEQKKSCSIDSKTTHS